MNKSKNNNSGTLGPAIAVVLGAGLNTDGTASERTIVRTEAAVQLAKLHPTLTVIVTGDGRTDTNRASEWSTRLVTPWVMPYSSPPATCLDSRRAKSIWSRRRFMPSELSSCSAASMVLIGTSSCMHLASLKATSPRD